MVVKFAKSSSCVARCPEPTVFPEPTMIPGLRITVKAIIPIINTPARTNRVIDVELIRKEWTPFAESERERATWLEAAIARRVDRRE